jgi:hypothetical protein
MYKKISVSTFAKYLYIKTQELGLHCQANKCPNLGCYVESHLDGFFLGLGLGIRVTWPRAEAEAGTCIVLV